MRAIAVAAILMLSTSPFVFAQQNGQGSPSQSAPTPSQPQTTPVQPERTPQQADQAKKEERQQSEDVHIGPGWKAHEEPSIGGGTRMTEDHSDTMGHMTQAEMMQHMRICREMMQRMGRGDREDDYGERRGYGDYPRYSDEYQYRREVRPRVKICIEDEDGGEYCRYR